MNRLILLLAIVSFAFGCNKDQFINDGNSSMTLSSDSIRFDTVFTSVGSITKSIKIFNLNDQMLLISSIRLAGGSNSAFNININGQASTQEQQIELPPGDSIYVFVRVSIDPSNATNPFIVSDSIEISCNGNLQWVQLEAYGQNAHFLNNHSVTSDENWVNDLPYVVSGSLNVQENVSLTIHKGVRIYMHGNASIRVQGSLSILGESGDSNKVVITNDRLDAPYNALPGAWTGLEFDPTSVNNEINWAVIRNAVNGISLKQDQGNDYQLSMRNSIIENTSGKAIASNGSSVYAENCLMSNNGQALRIENGGKHHLVHCTLASYSTMLVQHEQPLVFISDSFEDGGQTISFPTNALFENCIVWGDDGAQGNEVITDQKGTSNFLVQFTNSIIKTNNPDALQQFENCYLNVDPVFLNTDAAFGAFNFRLADQSPAIDNGIHTAVLRDLDNNNRSLPDVGCYEFVP
jgi:hypothetical protein